MSKKNGRKQKVRRRDGLFAQHPFCFWCGVKLVQPWNGDYSVPKAQRHPANAATLDHLDHKYDRKDWNKLGICIERSVLSCAACNNRRGRERLAKDNFRTHDKDCGRMMFDPWRYRGEFFLIRGMAS